MIMDRQLTCSTAQAVTGDAFSTVIDLAASGRDIGRSEELRAIALVGSAFTSDGAGTLIVHLVESANADLSSPTILASANGGVAYAVADLTAGRVLMDIAVPQTSKRYVAFQYDNGTAVFTGGTVTAGLVKNSPSPIAGRPTGNTGL